MSWREFLWSWRGRLNRRQALLGIYGVGIPATVVIMILIALFATPASNGGYLLSQETSFIVRILPNLAVLPLVASMLVRRVHDHGKSGRVVLVWLAVAVVALMFASVSAIRDTAWEVLLMLPISLSFFWLLLYPGDAGANKYGQPPAPSWWP